MAIQSSVLAWRLPMDRRDWWATVHRVEKSRTRLNTHTSFHTCQCRRLPEMQEEMQFQSLGGDDPLEEEMATPCSTLVWRVPWTEEPDGVQSMGSHRVRHN